MNEPRLPSFMSDLEPQLGHCLAQAPAFEEAVPPPPA